MNEELDFDFDFDFASCALLVLNDVFENKQQYEWIIKYR